MPTSTIGRCLIALSVFLFSACAYKFPATAPDLSGQKTFTLVIASDAQYPWWTQGQPDCSLESNVDQCWKQRTESAIALQLSAASKLTSLTWPNGSGNAMLGQNLAPIAGVVVNGDLTNYWHPENKDGMIKLVNTMINAARKSDPNNPLLTVPYFVGLGNHDYSNNACACSGFGPFDRNSCARDAVKTIRDVYSGVSWIGFDSCSVAYSFDLKGYRFLQLHLSPGYARDLSYYMERYDVVSESACQLDPHWRNPSTSRFCDGNNDAVNNSWFWLETKLIEADRMNLKSVLFFHAPNQETHTTGRGDQIQDYWTDADFVKFKALVSKHNVWAVFTGHIHDNWGRQCNGYPITQGLVNSSGQAVPLILSGASERLTFVAAEFGNGFINVGVVDARTGSPLWRTTRVNRQDGPPITETEYADPAKNLLTIDGSIQPCP